MLHCIANNVACGTTNWEILGTTIKDQVIVYHISMYIFICIYIYTHICIYYYVFVCVCVNHVYVWLQKRRKEGIRAPEPSVENGRSPCRF